MIGQRTTRKNQWIIFGILVSLIACREERLTLFTRLSESETRIDFNNLLKEGNPDFSILNYPYFYNGGGVAIGDVNNDGLQDIAFTGNMVSNRLYLNKGNLAFEDITLESGNGHNATADGVQPTTDALGLAGKAYKFSAGTNIIDVPNALNLNFQNQITLSFWLKLDALPAESYVLSHGSYQQRWKVSVIPNGKVRWTINTTSSIKDLDSSFPLQLNLFYHFTVVYTGYSMELYVNGVLDTFIAETGLISKATDDITFGRQTASIKNYSLFGTLDEVRIYDKALGPNEIIKLKTLWNTVTALQDELVASLSIFPNPSIGVINVKGIHQPIINVALLDILGRPIESSYSYVDSEKLLQVNFKSAPEVLILKIETIKEIVFRKVIVR